MTPPPHSVDELQSLYLRKMAVERAIRSLEIYEELRNKRFQAASGLAAVKASPKRVA
jgi:hypothetical protein